MYVMVPSCQQPIPVALAIRMKVGADIATNRHDLRADKRRYWHDRHVDSLSPKKQYMHRKVIRQPDTLVVPIANTYHTGYIHNCLAYNAA